MYPYHTHVLIQTSDEGRTTANETNLESKQPWFVTIGALASLQSKSKGGFAMNNKLILQKPIHDELTCCFAFHYLLAPQQFITISSESYD
jgi:hypothetical protein